MAHMFSLYSVAVRRNGDDQLLGNFDGQGADLRERVGAYLVDIEHEGEEDSQVLRSVKTEAPTEGEPSTVAAMLKHGRGGVRSDLYGADGQLAFQRTEDHTEQMPALALFALPPNSRRGVLVAHSPNGRGVRSVLTQVLKNRFNEDYPERNVALHIDPLVPGDVLEQLLGEEGLKRIMLVKYEPSADRFDNLGGYVEPADVGRIETHVVARGSAFLRRRRNLEGVAAEAAPGASFVFAGVDYDELRLKVEVGNRQRTVRIGEETAVGRLTYEIPPADLKFEDGYPTYGTLRAAALALLAEAVPEIAP